MLKLIWIVLLLSIISIINLYPQNFRLEAKQILIWADSPKDSLEFINKMEAKYPGMGVRASCMAVLEKDMNFDNPEVVFMQNDMGEYALYINICSVDTANLDYSSNKKVFDVPECLKEILYIYDSVNSIYFRNGIKSYLSFLKNDSVAINNFVNNFNFTYRDYNMQLDTDSLYMCLNLVRKAAESCDNKLLIDIFQSSDNQSLVNIASSVLFDSIDDEEILAAYFRNALLSSQGNSAELLNIYFDSMENKSYLIKNTKIRDLIIKMISNPKTSSINLAANIIPKIKNTDYLTQSLKRSNFNSVRKILEMNLSYSMMPAMTIMKHLYNTDLSYSKQKWIEFIDELK